MRALEKLKVVDKLFDRSSLESLDSSIRELDRHFFSFFENLFKYIDGFFNSFVSSILENEYYDKK